MLGSESVVTDGVSIISDFQQLHCQDIIYVLQTFDRILLVHSKKFEKVVAHVMAFYYSVRVVLKCILICGITLSTHIGGILGL